MRRLHAAALVLTVSVVASATTAASRLVQAQPVACEMLVLGGGYVASVNTALRSKTDVWGNRLLARPEGPTTGNVKGLPEAAPTRGQAGWEEGYEADRLRRLLRADGRAGRPLLRRRRLN